MKCLNCGHENSSELKFCPNCGTKLENNNSISTEENTAIANTNANVTDLSNTMPIPVINENNTNIENTNSNVTKLNNMSNTMPIPPITQMNISNQNTNKFNVKILLPILIVGFIVGIVIIIFLLSSIFKNVFSSNKSTFELLDPNQPILVEKNGKYGYINSNGKIIIKEQYDYASPFYGNFAIVEGKTIYEGNEVVAYHIIDKKGKIKETSIARNGIEFIADENIWIISGQLFNSKMKKLSKDGVIVDYSKNGILSWIDEKNKKAGIMNKNGKVTYTYKFKDNETYFSASIEDKDDSLKGNYCQINVNNERYAVVNCDNGKIIYDFTENYISAKKNNIFDVTTTSPYSKIKEFYVQNDKIEYQTSNSSTSLSYEPGYIKIYDSSQDYSKRYTFYDLSTKKVTDNEPSSSKDNNDLILESSISLTKYTCDKGVGLKNKDKVILDCEWSSIKPFDLLLYEYLLSKGKNYILSEKDSKTYLVNLKNGKIVKEFNTSYVTTYTLSTFISYSDKDTNKTVVYNLLTGKSIEIDKDSSLNVKSNYITVEQDSNINYYNTNLKLIYTKKQ